ncbi:DUF429 domain-containing protein [Desulfitobacterium sp. Sab5]|uniref:DUF429 domain-containing protein n=1 Tax=Desulfitobacterium nosdiversum TaxID=3375356 RepID=UPI003CEE28C8
MNDKYVLGVDAAWTHKEPSGVSLLRCLPGSLPELERAGRSYDEFCSGKIEWNSTPKGSLPSFKEIFDTITEHIDVVTLDIPLSPNPITGRRQSDNLISSIYGRLGASTHTPNADRPGYIATTIYEQLSELGFNWAYQYSKNPSFIEVYPHTAIIELFGYDYRFPYKVSKKAKYWPGVSTKIRNRNIIEKLMELKGNLESEVTNIDHFLIKLDPDKHYPIKFLKGYEDLIDSIISALVGYYYINQKATPYGDNIGTIWVPQKA